eukprot:PhF_6_TR32194/c0_g1_i5/m.47837
MFVINVDGWAVVADPQSFTNILLTKYPHLFVNSVPIPVGRGERVDVLCPASCTRTLSTKSVLPLCGYTKRNWVLIMTLALVVSSLIILNSHAGEMIGGSRYTQGASILTLILVGIVHCMAMSRERVRWLLRYFDAYYLCANMTLYVYTIGHEWAQSGAPWLVVVLGCILLLLSLMILFTVDASAFYPRWYRISIQVLGFVYFTSCWFLYKAAGHWLKPETQSVLNMEVDVGLLYATVESVRSFACIALALIMLRGTISFVVLGYEFQMLKEVYVMKASAIDLESVHPFLYYESMEEEEAKENSGGPTHQDLTMEDVPSTISTNPSEEKQQHEADGTTSPMYCPSVSEEVAEIGTNITKPPNNEHHKNSLELLRNGDENEYSRSLRHDHCVVGVRGYVIGGDTEDATQEVLQYLQHQYPFLNTSVKEIKGSFEVIAARAAVTMLGTVAIIPGADKLWDKKLLFSSYFVLTFIGALLESTPATMERITTNRVLSLYILLPVVSFLFIGIAISQTRHRIPLIFKTFESFFFAINILIYELTYAYVWYHIYPIPLMVIRITIFFPIKVFTIIGIDATRSVFRYLKTFVMISLGVAMCAVWFSHRFGGLFVKDTLASPYYKDVVEVGVVRSSIASIRMLASANLGLFYFRYGFSTLFLKHEFIILRMPLVTMTQD